MHRHITAGVGAHGIHDFLTKELSIVIFIKYILKVYFMCMRFLCTCM